MSAKIKFLAGSGGTPSKSKSEFRVGWRSRDDHDRRYRRYRYHRSFFCAAVFFAPQFFLRRSFFAPQFFLRCCFLLRQQVTHKGIKFLAGSGGTPSKSKSEFRVGWWSRDDSNAWACPADAVYYVRWPAALHDVDDHMPPSLDSQRAAQPPV